MVVSTVEPQSRVLEMFKGFDPFPRCLCLIEDPRKDLRVNSPSAEAAQTPSPYIAPVRFAKGDAFYKELKRRVDAYFTDTGKDPRDAWQMYLKTAIVIAWFVGAYLLLVFVAQNWWQGVLASLTLGLGMAAIGFNIQHDGGHRAYSRFNLINKMMAMTIDLLGGSSYVWNIKHNSIHHTYANITGHDDDIDVGILARLSPHQKRLPFHRLQHFYMWPLYGLIAVKWQLFDDFFNVAIGKIGNHKLARPKGWDLVLFLFGKAFFYTIAFVIPLMFHKWYIALGFYGLVNLFNGVVLSTVFQLAHCVEEAQFPMPDEATNAMETHWAVHQIETTVDFARRSKVLTWLLGGLNYQVEHHLFHKICHVHYPALSKVVEETCREYEIKYNEHKTFMAGVISHFRWLKRMGLPAT
jgi:linoleoyl-CoA desaturase